MAPMTHEYSRRIADENYPESNSHKALNAAADMAKQLATQAERIAVLTRLLTRYRTETPLGHQPYMIADEVDAAIETSKGSQQP